MTHAANICTLYSSAMRQDLLRVGGDTEITASAPETALRNMGYRVERRRLHHWVLTTGQPLPELHFYSKAELTRFVTGRAAQYLTHTDRSLHHANATHLPGRCLCQ